MCVFGPQKLFPSVKVKYCEPYIIYSRKNGGKPAVEAVPQTSEWLPPLIPFRETDRGTPALFVPSVSHLDLNVAFFLNEL
jgi:hypothetical protein